jgi:hypothetical protein
VALWAFVVLALAVALTALIRARRLARRLDVLNQSYWELRYDYTRLRSQLSRLDPDQAAADERAESLASPDTAAAPPPVSFVPLSSLKRKGP